MLKCYDIKQFIYIFISFLFLNKQIYDLIFNNYYYNLISFKKTFLGKKKFYLLIYHVFLVVVLFIKNLLINLLR